MSSKPSHFIFHATASASEFIIKDTEGWRKVPAPEALAGVANPSMLFLDDDRIFIAGGSLKNTIHNYQTRIKFSKTTLIFNWKTSEVT